MLLVLQPNLTHFPRLFTMSLEEIACIHVKARKRFKHSYNQLTTNRLQILFELESITEGESLMKEVFAVNSVVSTSQFLSSIALFSTVDSPAEIARFILHCMHQVRTHPFHARDSFPWLWNRVLANDDDTLTLEQFISACRSLSGPVKPPVISDWQSVLTETVEVKKSKALIRKKSVMNLMPFKKRMRPLGAFSSFSQHEFEVLQSIWFKSGASADGYIDMRTVLIILRNESKIGETKDRDFLDKVIANLMALHSGGLVKVIEGDRKFSEFVAFLIPDWVPDTKKDTDVIKVKTEVDAESLEELKEIYSYLQKKESDEKSKHCEFDLSTFESFLADFLPRGFVPGKGEAKKAVLKEGENLAVEEDLRDPLVTEMENKFNASHGGQVILDSRKLNVRQMRFSERRALNE